MTRRSRIWGIAAVAFTVINVLGAIYARFMGERGHMDLHLVLLLAGAIAYLTWRARSRGRVGDAGTAEVPDARLDYLQRSVDAMALELERLGEAQRFRDRIQNPPVTPPTRKDQ